MRFAFATDNEEEFTRKHFGSAEKYLIYNLDKDWSLEKKQENISVEEETHGDPKKAKSVADMLNNADVLVSKIFGPNINKMKKKFIIVVMNSTWNIEEAKTIILKNKEKITELLKKNEKDVLFL